MFSTSNPSSSVPIPSSSVPQKHGTSYAQLSYSQSRNYAQRPADAPDPDSSWTSLDKAELNKLVRELLSECKQCLVCPSCNKSGNITKSSANGDIRLQCVTKGLASGTKKGQCGKSWNLATSLAVLNYAKSIRPNQSIYFWSEKQGKQRSAGTASRISSSTNGFTQSVNANPVSFSQVPSPTQILHCPQSTQNLKDGELNRDYDPDLVPTQVLPSRRLVQVNSRGHRTFIEVRLIPVGTESGKEQNVLDSSTAPKNVATRGRQQTPFHHLKPTPFNKKISHEAAERFGMETAGQGNDDSSPLANYSHSPTSANHQTSDVPVDVMGMICEYSSSQQRDFVPGSGSDADILANLKKRIPARRLRSPDQCE
jgi:hypothetical protein